MASWLVASFVVVAVATSLFAEEAPTIPDKATPASPPKRSLVDVLKAPYPRLWPPWESSEKDHIINRDEYYELVPKPLRDYITYEFSLAHQGLRSPSITNSSSADESCLDTTLRPKIVHVHFHPYTRVTLPCAFCGSQAHNGLEKQWHVIAWEDWHIPFVNVTTKKGEFKSQSMNFEQLRDKTAKYDSDGELLWRTIADMEYTNDVRRRLFQLALWITFSRHYFRPFEATDRRHCR